MLPVIMHFESSPRAYRGWDLAARKLSKIVGRCEGGKIPARSGDRETDGEGCGEEISEAEIGRMWDEDEMVYREFCHQ